MKILRRIRNIFSSPKARGYIKLNYFRAETYKNPRWGHGKPPHKELFDIINSGRDRYKESIRSSLEYAERYLGISVKEDAVAKGEPFINNSWFPVLDSFALYSLIAARKPSRFVEIGSGNSTLFVARAIKDFGLDTKIISIDPEPRAEVDVLCTEVIREPVEESDLAFFDTMEAGEVLFIDNSHRTFMNSDVTVVFLEILPRLKPGVIVHIHDIFLPMDYPPEWGKRYYSEQYLLAMALISKSRYEVILPNYFIKEDVELFAEYSPLLSDKRLVGIPQLGNSFWMITK